MSNKTISGTSTPLRGEIIPPGDKSISHRSLILGSLANGHSTVKDFLISDDTISTANAMRALGIKIVIEGNHVEIDGKGPNGLRETRENYRLWQLRYDYETTNRASKRTDIQLNSDR